MNIASIPYFWSDLSIILANLEFSSINKVGLPSDPNLRDQRYDFLSTHLAKD